jgi:hypothetical protein
MLDSNNLTSTFLTAFEKWYLSNGTEILHEPSPYNMTKMDESLLPRDQATTNQQLPAQATG